jgi:hypothetical protein
MNDRIKDQALEYCIEIFKCYTRGEVSNLSTSVVRAWKVGKRADSLINKKVANRQPSLCGYCKEPTPGIGFYYCCRACEDRAATEL